MNKLLISLIMPFALVASGAQAAGDVSAGKTKSAVCAACHGPDGNGSPANAAWPKLAGQNPEYIQKQIADFKSGARTDPTMAPMAAPLSPEDVADLAAYFSSQKKSPGKAAADKVAAGERVYRGGNSATGVAACMGCHGPTGAGNPAAGFPAIWGQNAAYVEKALKDFRSGARANDPATMMRGVAAKMSDDEIVAVAQYVQGLTY